MARSQSTLYLAATGMITPIGPNSVCTAAAVRAGISAHRFTEYRNKALEPMTLALVPDAALPPLKDGLGGAVGMTARRRRLLQLATPALQEVLSTYPASGHSLALLLAGPETLPGCPTAIDDTFLDHLAIQTDLPLQRNHCRLMTTGRAGGVHVLELAFRYLEETPHDVVLVGGVDSYQDRYVLGYLGQPRSCSLARPERRRGAGGSGGLFVAGHRTGHGPSWTGALVHPGPTWLGQRTGTPLQPRTVSRRRVGPGLGPGLGTAARGDDPYRVFQHEWRTLLGQGTRGGHDALPSPSR